MASTYHNFHPSLWTSTFSNPPTTNPSSISPTMTSTSTLPSSTSPPISKGYETAVPTTSTGSISPDPHMQYGYPPTPPKEVKAEESYFSGTSGSSGLFSTADHVPKRPEQGSDTYSLPSPASSATPSIYDSATPLYAGYSAELKKSSKSSGKNSVNGTSHGEIW